MSNFSANRLDERAINSGQTYTDGDTPSADSINRLIEGVMFVSDQVADITNLVDAINGEVI